MINNRFRFSVAELLVFTTAIAVLAAEAQIVGFPAIAFAVLATLAALTLFARRLLPSWVLFISVPLLVLLIVWLLLPDVQ